MASFTPSKKTTQDFNNGVEYVDGQDNETGDAVQADTVNNLVESALYTQEQVDNAVSAANSVVSLATNQPNVSEANNIGIPAVTIENTSSGGKRFKFSNLKGEEGITPNISVNATIDNNVGNPNVTVTKSGTTENPQFNIAFNNLKGEKGDSAFYGFDVINGKLIVTSATEDKVSVTINNGHLVYKM